MFLNKKPVATSGSSNVHHEYVPSSDTNCIGFAVFCWLPPPQYHTHGSVHFVVVALALIVTADALNAPMLIISAHRRHQSL